MIHDEDIIELDDPKLSPSEKMYLPQILGGMKVTLGHMVKSMMGQTETVQYPEQKRELNVTPRIYSKPISGLAT